MAWKCNFVLKVNKIPPAKNAIHNAIAERLTVASQDIVGDAKKLCPVNTGNLRRNIRQEVKLTRRGFNTKIFTTCGYGGYVEVGTRKMAAQPFIRPAFDRNKAKIRNALRVCV